MRAAAVASPGQVRPDETSPSAPGPNEVLVRVVACGLCTTDIDILEGRFWGDYPITPRHEISGTVEALGDGVTAIRLATSSRSILTSRAVSAAPAGPARHTCAAT